MNKLHAILIIILIVSFTACSGGGGSSSTKSDTTLHGSSIFKASFAPAQNSIADNASIILEFSQELDESTITAENIYLLDSTGKKIIIDISIEGSYIKIVPQSRLILNGVYTLTVTTDVKNADGTSLNENYEWEFTATSTDITSPLLKSTLPLAGSNSADITTSIILEFDELLDTTNIQDATLELKDSLGSLVSGTFKYSNQWLVFFPSSNLKSNETYTVNIVKDIYDLSSNVYSSSKSFSFTTSSSALNSDGFSKVSTDLDLSLESYSMLVLDDSRVFVGSKDKIFKVLTTRENGVPKITLDSTKDSSEFGTIYDIKTLKTRGSCSAYSNLILATSKGISILDTNDLSIKSSLDTQKSVFGLDVVCNSSNSHVYAYLANSNSGVTILDITDAKNIKEINSFLTEGIAFDVISKHDKIYVASYSDGVNVYDNSGTLLQHFNSNSTTRALEIDASELIVSDGITGAKKFTISAQGVLSESISVQSQSSIINSYSTADNIFAITISKGISVIDKNNPSVIAYQIPSISRFINAGTDSEFLYTLSLDGIVSAYNLDSTEVSGQAIDGYLSQATIFKDCNNNKTLDMNIDIHTIADTNGSYLFTDIPYTCKDANLIAQGGVDVDTGIEFTGMLVAKSGSKNITPLTTLIEADPTLEATLISELGLSSIDEDFVAAKNPQAMKLALSITNTLSNISDNFSIEKSTVVTEKIASELKANPASITDEALMSDAIAQAAADTFDEIVASNPDMALFFPSTNDYQNSIGSLVDTFSDIVDINGTVSADSFGGNLYSETISLEDGECHIHAFTLNEQTEIEATSTPIDIDTVGYLYDDRGALVAESDDHNDLEFYMSGVLPAGDYELEVCAEYGDITDATIVIKSTGGHQPVSTPDVTLTKDITIDGNFIQNNSSINLDGYKLTVKGNYTQLGDSTLTFPMSGRGSLEVFGNYKILEGSSLYMGGGGANMTIHNNLVLNSTGENLLSGTMTLSGNVLQRIKNSDYTVRDLKIVINGSKKQVIDLDTIAQAELNIVEVTNTSESGVELVTKILVLDEYINSNTPIINQENLKFGLNYIGISGVINGGFILDEPTTLNKNIIIKGDLYHKAARLDLNGFTLTVEGNYLQTKSASLKIDEGTLEVKGDYNATGGSGSFSSSLIIQNSGDTLIVHGNFNMHSNSSNSLKDGTLKLYGDFSQKVGNNNFSTVGNNFKVVLIGNDKQTISFEYPYDPDISIGQKGSGFAILDLQNSSSQGVEFLTKTVIHEEYTPSSSTVVNGLNLEMSTEIAVKSGRVYGDLETDGYFELRSDLKVDGNLHVYETLNLDSYTLLIGGNLILEGDALLRMNHSSSKLEVHGNFNMHATEFNAQLTNGILYLHGNFSQEGNAENFYTEGNFKTILVGDTRQTISFEDPFDSCFNNLDIQNTSDEGVEFLTKALVAGDFNQNNNLIVSSLNLYLSGIDSVRNGVIDNSVYLSEDTILTEDLMIKGNIYHYKPINAGECNFNTLDLNGFNLNLNGNYIQSGEAELKFHSGTFEIDGDYNSTTSCEGNSLFMTTENDKLKVHSSLYLHANNFSNNILTHGTIYLDGNLSVHDSNFNASNDGAGKHKMIFSGNTKQTIFFESGNFYILDINNSSSDGVELLSTVLVDNDYYKEANSAISGLSLTVNGNSYIYNNLNLTVDLSNITSHTISEVYLKSSLYGEELLLDTVTQNSYSFVNQITDVNNYSLKVKLDDNSIWWYNFNTSTFCTTIDDPADFEVNSTTDLEIILIDSWQ